MLRALLAVLVIAGPASAAVKPVGVSEWDAAAVADFFYQKAGIRVDAKLIAEANIQGDDLFDGLIDEVVLSTQLGVTRPLDQKRILKAITDLDKTVSDAPGSLWDWRAANLRLCDMWLLPLYGASPSFLLIWSRYFDESEGILDALDDSVDKCGLLWFWTMVIFIPCYPIYSLAAASPIGGFAGTVIYLTALLNFLGNVLSILSFFKYFPKRVQKEIGGLILACVSYYVFWWVSFKFVLDFFFYLNLYVASPVVAIGNVMFIGFLVFTTGILVALSN